MLAGFFPGWRGVILAVAVAALLNGVLGAAAVGGHVASSARGRVSRSHRLRVVCKAARKRPNQRRYCSASRIKRLKAKPKPVVEPQPVVVPHPPPPPPPSDPQVEYVGPPSPDCPWTSSLPCPCPPSGGGQTGEPKVPPGYGSVAVRVYPEGIEPGSNMCPGINVSLSPEGGATIESTRVTNVEIGSTLTYALSPGRYLAYATFEPNIELNTNAPLEIIAGQQTTAELKAHGTPGL